MIILLFIVAIGTEIARELCFKLANNSQTDTSAYYLHMLTNLWIWAGFVFWGIEIVAWLTILKTVPLGVAFPIMSLCYVGLPLMSYFILNERIARLQWIGIGLITAGVVLISMNNGL